MSSVLFQQVVDHFGSQPKTATALNIKQPTVSYMLRTGVISVDVALRIQKTTNGKFNALDLRPSLKENFESINVA